MPRLRNIQTGAVMSVSDATAARLGAEWQPVDTPPVEVATPDPPRRRRPRKASQTD